jgi:crossover junction endodeoxyribonuclease RuvC
MKKYFIGIDPGLRGAIVLINQDCKLLGYWDMPTVLGRRKKIMTSSSGIVEVMEIINGYCEREKCLVTIEKSQSMPNQGVVSSFTNGRSFGQLEGIMDSLRVDYFLVSPKEWTVRIFKKFKSDIAQLKHKERSLTIAKKLFPSLALTRPRGKKLSINGRSDAALIAYYGMLMYQQSRDS